MSDDLPQHLHSAAYFGDTRDFWWNHDYVALLARRADLAGVTRALDAGCGVGHWGRVLLPHMPAASLVGVDRESAWVDEAAKRAAAAGFADRATYRRGPVEALPFEDASFDLVTCQTVLIHVPDVARVLREFLRVLRPGGRVLLAEPNNLANALLIGSARHRDPVDDTLDLVRTQMLCERGKIALGEGDNSLGELLPGMVSEAGYTGLQCWLSDRVQLLVPPYEGADQRAARDEMLDLDARDFWIWSRDETRRYYLAGGGAEADFDAAWDRCRRASAREAKALREGTFHMGVGGSHFVVAARKPA
jgi:SAM-dependent methyltransferase